MSEPTVTYTPPAAGTRPVAPASRALVGIPPVALAIAGVVSVIALGGLAMLLTSNNASLASDLITRMAARDAAAGTLLADTDLASFAAEMGISGVPASVSLSVEGMKAASETVGDTEILTAHYTLHATGPSGEVDSEAQTLTATVMNTATGKRLVEVIVEPPLEFDPAVYYPVGTSAADASSVAADLEKGNVWLGGSATVDPETVPIASIYEDIANPSLWEGAQGIVDVAGVDGEETTWVVRVDVPGAAPVTLTGAKATTKQMVGGRMHHGTMSEESAMAGATAAANAFVAAAQEGQDVSSFFVAGSSSISAVAAKANTSGRLHLEEGSYPLTSSDYTEQPAVMVGALKLALDPSGRWLIDPEASQIIEKFAPSGDSFNLYDISDLWGACSTSTINITLDGIAWYHGRNKPSAIFTAEPVKGTCGTRMGSGKISWKGMTSIPIPVFTISGGVVDHLDVPLDSLIELAGPFTVTFGNGETSSYPDGDVKLKTETVQ